MCQASDAFELIFLATCVWLLSACKVICRIGGQSNESLLGAVSWRGVYPIASIRHALISVGRSVLIVDGHSDALVQRDISRTSMIWVENRIPRLKLSSKTTHRGIATMYDVSSVFAIHVCYIGQEGFQIRRIFYACFLSTSSSTRP